MSSWVKHFKWCWCTHLEDIVFFFCNWHRIPVVSLISTNHHLRQHIPQPFYILCTIHYTCTIPVGIAKIRFNLIARQSIWIFILFYFWLQIALIYTFFVVKLFFFLLHVNQLLLLPHFRFHPMHFVDNQMLCCCICVFHFKQLALWILFVVLYCVGYVNIRFNSTAFYDSCLLHYIYWRIDFRIVNTHASKNWAQIRLKLCVLFYSFYFWFQNRVLFDTCYSKSVACVGKPSI